MHPTQASVLSSLLGKPPYWLEPLLCPMDPQIGRLPTDISVVEHFSSKNLSEKDRKKAGM